MAGKPRDDEHLVVLRAIWNELKSLNGRVDQTNARLEQTNEGLDGTNARLEQTNEGLDGTNARLEGLREELKREQDALLRRMVESEVRLATVTTQLSGDVRELSGLIREWREEHRTDRADLRARVARLEVETGIGPPF